MLGLRAYLVGKNAVFLLLLGWFVDLASGSLYWYAICCGVCPMPTGPAALDWLS
jgi:hypothetical protein